MALLAISVGLGAGCPTPRDPKRSQTRVDLAKDLLKQGHDVEAESELKKALVFDPRNEEAHLVYGIVYTYRAARETELLEYENCLGGAEEEQVRAQVDAKMRKAEEHFAQAVKLAPDYGEAWMNRSVVAMHFRDFERAVEHATAALQNAARLGSVALAHANLGWASFRNKDFTRAITELLQATQLEPRLCLARYYLAEVYFDRERYEEAYEALALFQGQDGQAPLCPPVLEAFRLGGQTALRLGDIDGALVWFQQCIEVKPRSCIARQCEKSLGELGAGS